MPGKCSHRRCQSGLFFNRTTSACLTFSPTHGHPTFNSCTMLPWPCWVGLQCCLGCVEGVYNVALAVLSGSTMLPWLCWVGLQCCLGCVEWVLLLLSNGARDQPWHVLLRKRYGQYRSTVTSCFFFAGIFVQLFFFFVHFLHVAMCQWAATSCGFWSRRLFGEYCCLLCASVWHCKVLSFC